MPPGPQQLPCETIIEFFKKVKGQSRFQAKVKGQRRFQAEVKSQAKILALTMVAGGSIEVCEVTPP